MKHTPLSRCAASPPLSPCFAMRAGGRSQRGGAALARLPALGARRFCALRVANGVVEQLK